jgi:hypothetical protein
MRQVENRIKVAAQQAVRSGTYYWEALAIDLDTRLVVLLSPEALVLSAPTPDTSRCEVLREFHEVTRAQCLLMTTWFPGRVLADASFGLRYSQHPEPRRFGDPAGVGGRMWTLRIVLNEGVWKVDPYTEERDWSKVGSFTVRTRDQCARISRSRTGEPRQARDGDERQKPKMPNRRPI